MKAWQSFVFRWCSGWVELEGKAERKKGGWVFFFFLLPLNSLWLCQSVLKQPFSFLADSSTIPSEMLIWQLSAPSSAFPSLTSLYLRDEIALARPFFVPMSPLPKVHTQKQSLNSDLFRISTNVGEGQRLCKILHLPWQKKQTKTSSRMLLNTTPCHNSPTQWPFFVLNWKEPISGTFICFACGWKL